MTLFNDFAEAFGLMPEGGFPSVLPFINKMVSEKEMQLVVAMKGAGVGSITTDQVADLMHMSCEESSKLLEKSAIRGIVSKKVVDGKTVYSTSSFDNFLGTFAKNDKNWDELPLYLRKYLAEWRYGLRRKNKWPKRAEQLKRGEPIKRDQRDLYVHDDEILLLEEVLERIDAAEDFAVLQCECRRLESTCDFPTETCIRFDDSAKYVVSQGLGRRLTKDEMKELVIKLDRKGLIHTGKHNWKTLGTTGFCNCCLCCCYPLRGALESRLKGIWPRSFYIAEYDSEKCKHCGLCLKRCQLGAWSYNGAKVEINGVQMNKVVFDPEKCWGCGLCANTCPTKAITMKKLDLSNCPPTMQAESK